MQTNGNGVLGTVSSITTTRRRPRLGPRASRQTLLLSQGAQRRDVRVGISGNGLPQEFRFL
ncbi:MAG: hypothetical protein WCA38_17000 [Candidatus Acidiferrales bacterium]